jgi:hypothetical protein
MNKKNIEITIDSDNGIKKVYLCDGVIAKTTSLSDEGCIFLDNAGADIILDFDKDGKLLNIELIGF